MSVFQADTSKQLSEIGLLIGINRKVSDRFHQGFEDVILSFVKSGASEQLMMIVSFQKLLTVVAGGLFMAY